MTNKNSSCQPIDQFHFLLYEILLIVNHKWWRWITCWFGGSIGIIISYRMDRFFFLLLGDAWAGVRLFFYPIFFLLRCFSFPHEIHYKSEIGKGLKILHPVLGVVVSGYATIGTNFTLTGGNCIGGRKQLHRGGLVIGNNVTVGANACILGPAKIGNNVTVGAGAIVVNDASDNVALIGIPARVTESA